jgi:hypothetical protein
VVRIKNSVQTVREHRERCENVVPIRNRCSSLRAPAWAYHQHQYGYHWDRRILFAQKRCHRQGELRVLGVYLCSFGVISSHGFARYYTGHRVENSSEVCERNECSFIPEFTKNSTDVTSLTTNVYMPRPSVRVLLSDPCSMGTWGCQTFSPKRVDNVSTSWPPMKPQFSSEKQLLLKRLYFTWRTHFATLASVAKYWFRC